MAKSTKLTSTKKRVKIKELPAAQKKMSSKAMKKVKGGLKIEMEDVLVTGVTSNKRK